MDDPITGLSWGTHVNDLKEVVELDQKLNMIILDFLMAEKKACARFGCKQLTPRMDALDPGNSGGLTKWKVKWVVMAIYSAFIKYSSVWSDPYEMLMMHSTYVSAGLHEEKSVTVEAMIPTLDHEERKICLRSNN